MKVGHYVTNQTEVEFRAEEDSCDGARRTCQAVAIAVESDACGLSSSIRTGIADTKSTDLASKSLANQRTGKVRLVLRPMMSLVLPTFALIRLASHWVRRLRWIGLDPRRTKADRERRGKENR
ncbi:unnamed protein product [Protopolystoma xenopodis]|uniref:Uncharacterized protein n=1 Tax=Protopolystoma xenopodis TaxID=117903 RepID=A0A448X7J3_9PLAT|nr:unnamed protein product [Protopolystoma xenopodis]